MVGFSALPPVFEADGPIERQRRCVARIHAQAQGGAAPASPGDQRLQQARPPRPRHSLDPDADLGNARPRSVSGWRRRTAGTRRRRPVPSRPATTPASPSRPSRPGTARYPGRPAPARRWALSRRQVGRGGEHAPQEGFVLGMRGADAQAARGGHARSVASDQAAHNRSMTDADPAVRLRPMRPDELPATTSTRSWHAHGIETQGGQTAEFAREVGGDRRDPARWPRTPGHTLWIVEADGERVGLLWLAERDSGGRRVIFIYDVEIDDAHRGKGYGRAAWSWPRSRPGPGDRAHRAQRLRRQRRGAEALSLGGLRGDIGPDGEGPGRGLVAVVQQLLGGGDRVERAIRHGLDRRVPVGPRFRASPGRIRQRAAQLRARARAWSGKRARTDATRSPAAACRRPRRWWPW